MIYTTQQLLGKLHNEILTDIEPLAGPVPQFVLFVSVCDGVARATTFSVKAASFKDCWNALMERTQQTVAKLKRPLRWIRIDRVDKVEALSWAELNQRLAQTKRNYFRYGISLDRSFKAAFLETELNANAMLYGGPQIEHAQINKGHFLRYMKERNAGSRFALKDDDTVYLFATQGLFVSAADAVVRRLVPEGRNAGRREIERLSTEQITDLIAAGSNFLARQVSDAGRFLYGMYPCFDREIETYNSLRHASTLYSMIEAWQITRDADLKSAIERAMDYLKSELIKSVEIGGSRLSFLVDLDNEIKLGGNAVCLLALTKYEETTGNETNRSLMRELADGILYMQDPASGKFSHILNFPDLSIKDPFRIIYYDGEAAFGLMRAYAVLEDPRYLDAVERAFSYFIEADHWKAHDHWLSYAVNELTRYRPRRDYFEFGIKNFAGHLDFVIDRITTYPTLLELMMAAQEMLVRLQLSAENGELLDGFDLEKFYVALETRAHYLLNGHFWPELAMFYANPERILGGFFIRHHAFRVRIDDVEHYLSGYCAYLRYRLGQTGSARTNVLKRAV